MVTYTRTHVHTYTRTRIHQQRYKHKKHSGYKNKTKSLKANMFKQLKRTNSEVNDSYGDYDAVPSAQTETLSPVDNDDFKRRKTSATQPAQPKFYSEFDSTATEIRMDKPYTNAPDEAMQLMNGKYNACLASPLVQFGYNKLGPKANIGNYSFGSVDESAAKFSVNLLPGLPEKVASRCPDEVERNKAYFKWLHEQTEALLRAAFRESNYMVSQTKKAVSEAKKRNKKKAEGDAEVNAEDVFVEMAENSLFKDKAPREGEDEVENVVLYRKYQYKDREIDEFKSNRPKFWKPLKSSGGAQKFEQLHPDYIPYGTVGKIKLTFRMYTMGGRYGVAADLGPDIIVVWKPKKKEREMKQVAVFADSDED